MLIIPWSTEANFEQNITLDNIVYTMSASWNSRAEAWFFSLSTIDNIKIVNNKKVTLLTDLLSYANKSYKPLGILLVYSFNLDTNQIITRDNFDSDVQLIYFNADEIL